VGESLYTVFIGCGEYRDEEPFEESMMVHFSKQLRLVELSGINELLHSTPCKQKHMKRVKEQNRGRKDNVCGCLGGSIHL
jgi:hypothetical protein